MSGGMDSTSCAHFLKKRGATVHGIFIDYGHAAAKREWRAVSKICEYLKIPLSKYVCSKNSRFGAGELIGRNSFLISTTLFLLSEKPEMIAIGIHGGSPYYDCSHDFLHRMSELVAAETDGRVHLLAPFYEWTKAQVFDYFRATNIPIEITYSCEAGSKRPCGTCLSCRDRRALGVS